ncbi:hypothetical protein F4V58_05185 [Corynebacterium phocae]|nr:hypothetical protein F4V58_05185 [Corynebacterium phocae]
MHRAIKFWPDVNLGSRNLNHCYRSWDRGNWGNVASGLYYGEVQTFDWNQLTIEWPKVVY